MRAQICKHVKRLWLFVSFPGFNSFGESKLVKKNTRPGKRWSPTEHLAGEGYPNHANDGAWKGGGVKMKGVVISSFLCMSISVTESLHMDGWQCRKCVGRHLENGKKPSKQYYFT